MEVIWTKHAEDRQKEWQRKLGITREEVENLMRNPQQIVPGDLSVLVAQIKRGNGLLRVPFIESRGRRRIVTVYWTTKVEKYWKGGM